VSEQFALRVLSLAESMRGYLDKLEAEERDPDVLETLYRVDHAATRVQRLAENLQVLAGRRPGDAEGQVTSLIDVIRAGMSAVEHYSRVYIGKVVDLAVVDWAADDVGRVMAELLDNATRYSPPASTVSVSAHLTEQGTVMLRVEDVGIGFDPRHLASVNAKLDSEASGLDPEAPTQMGLAVVQRLARAHGMRVGLVRREPVGTTAMVLLPVPLLCELPSERPTRPKPSPRRSDGASAGKALVVRSPRMPTTIPPQTTTGGAQRVVELSVPPGMSQPTADRLPQRVPSSIRQMPEMAQFAQPADPDDVVNQKAWHDDLAAFVAGDTAARSSDSVGSGQHRPEGPTK
jgi:two-component sensor histidine kinase